MTQHQGFLVLAAAALLSVLIVAQSRSLAEGAQTPPPRPGQTMSMPDMMKGCQQHCQSTAKTIDQISRDIDQAKASNDPAKMRAVLDQTQKPLADMKQHMNMCMNMMSMMQKMQQK